MKILVTAADSLALADNLAENVAAQVLAIAPVPELVRAI